MNKVTTSTSFNWHEKDNPPADAPGNYLVRYDSAVITLKHGHRQITSRTVSLDWDGQRWLGEEPSAWRPHFQQSARREEPERPEGYVPKAAPDEETRAKIAEGVRRANQEKAERAAAAKSGAKPTRKADKGQTSPEVRARISAAVKAANERRKQQQGGK